MGLRSWFGLGGRSRRQASNPLLKQFGDLSASDFELHPIWVSCHGTDQDEPWHDDTDEETFRPWTGQVPVDPADGIFLVRSRFRIASGQEYAGFVTPAMPQESGNLGAIQPHMAVAGRFVSFWYGMMNIPAETKSALYVALRKKPSEVFPIRFEAEPDLTIGIASGEIAGFYRRPAPGAAPEMEQ
jgi:hypothetical protein